MKKTKPRKPSKSFPLTPHPSGQWCKTIKYKLYYFGVWEDPEAALAKYEHDAPFIRRGLNPSDPIHRIELERLTLQGLCDLFLMDRLESLSAGSIVHATIQGYEYYTRRLLSVISGERVVESLTPYDFQILRSKLSKPLNGQRQTITAKSTETAVTHIRAIFNFGAKNFYIKKSLPELWGTKFEKPRRKQIRKESHQRANKVASRKEILAMIDFAEGAMKALILLGINCGLGCTDAGLIRFENIDFQSQKLNLPRNKTGEPRQAFLWPETIEAINESIKCRKEPTSPADNEFVFITDVGGSFKAEGHYRPITRRISTITKLCKIKRDGLSFYSLRHTFQTIADNETLDFVGVRAVMGHADSSISGNYRHGVTDERLKRIADAVRAWLFSA